MGADLSSLPVIRALSCTKKLRIWLREKQPEELVSSKRFNKAVKGTESSIDLLLSLDPVDLVHRDERCDLPEISEEFLGEELGWGTLVVGLESGEAFEFRAELGDDDEDSDMGVGSSS